MSAIILGSHYFTGVGGYKAHYRVAFNGHPGWKCNCCEHIFIRKIVVQIENIFKDGEDILICEKCCEIILKGFNQFKNN